VILLEFKMLVVLPYNLILLLLNNHHIEIVDSGVDMINSSCICILEVVLDVFVFIMAVS
jgi:hypothetical protein